MADSLVFHPFRQHRLAALADRKVDGRSVVSLKLELTNASAAGTSDTRDVDVHLAGPGDVETFQDGAVILMAPPPFASDAETTKLVHADLRAEDLPWRYALPGSGPIPLPWLALLVGTREEFTVAGKLLSFASPGKAAEVLGEYDFAAARAWAHVQETPGAGGKPLRIARLVGLRGRQDRFRPQTEYIAAVVRALKDDGGPAWGAAFPETLPVLHSWTFWTGEEGDFETLATAIKPRAALGLGRVELFLPRVLDDGGNPIMLAMRGAIGSLADDPDSDVLDMAKADIAALRSPCLDQPPLGMPARTIIGLPDYARPWLTEATAAQWSKDVNGDPRLRGSAGLGGWIGREAQEDLIKASVEQIGALNAALQRVAHLAIGLGAARSLWSNRFPADTGRRLRVFGPGTARIETATGSVQSAVTGADSPLPQAFLTSAAMRVMRRGTARTRGADGTPDGAYRRAGTLADAANAVPQPLPPVPSSPFDIDAAATELNLPKLDDLRITAPLPLPIVELIERYLGRLIDDEWPLSEFIPDLRRVVEDNGLQGFGCSNDVILQSLLKHEFEWTTRSIFCEALTHCRMNEVGIESPDLLLLWFGRRLTGSPGYEPLRPEQLTCMLTPVPPQIDLRRPRNLDNLVDRLGELIDPTRPRPPGWRRVESTIEGLSLDSLAPQEMPVGIDLPTWTLLRRHDKEWLLPGVGALQKHSVVALKTNPRFIAAFLAGLNSQFLAEMHWRNMAVDRTGTPLLQFWGQFDYTEGKRQPDVLPIAEWDTVGQLGSKAHQWLRPGDLTGREDVVIVFRTDLFRRYPRTQVYLSRRTGDDLKLGPDFSPAQAMTPPATRKELGPIYQGQIESDIVFFGFDIDPATLSQYQLVLDEPPAELRFRNDRPAATTNGAEFAAATIDRHSRVAFLGSYLAAQGLVGP